ncbi:MAG: HAD-IIB family hydrolase [Thermodesulfobacteriota bacterium]
MIIFTDLDGSLLDHGDYSWVHAGPALDLLQKREIPVIICTSKTFGEAELIQRDMGLTGPLIVENGNGIFFPLDFIGLADTPVHFRNGRPCLELGKSYGVIRLFFKELQRKFAVRGFGDMTVAEVAARTNLSVEKAAMAKIRDFSEPFVLEKEDQLGALEEVVARRGFRITKGGRFYHLSDCRGDKGRATKLVAGIFSAKWGVPVRTVGLGDSPNDYSMLEQVDIPVLIPNRFGRHEDFVLRDLVRAPFPGSRGWNAVIFDIFDHDNEII